MIRSMTGFGQHDMRDERSFIRAGIKAVNARGLTVKVNLPEELAACEPDVEEAIKKRLKRGTVYVFVEYESLGSEPEYTFNAEVIKSYYTTLKDILADLGQQNGAVDIASLLSLPGCVSKASAAWPVSAAVRERVLEVVNRALSALLSMRSKEGARMEDELRGRSGKIASLLTELERRAPEMLERYRSRLTERVRKALNGTTVELSPADVAREVALFAERSDISEEVSRLRSHLAQLCSSLDSDGSVGRKLEFISQEMFREANTIASKAGQADMLPCVLELKGEVDRMREQIMNIE